jgi:hypothetical protein
MKKVLNWAQQLADNKKYFELVGSILTIPVMATVIMLNATNLSKNMHPETSQKNTTEAQNKEMSVLGAVDLSQLGKGKTEVVIVTPQGSTTPTVSVTPTHTPVPASPTPTPTQTANTSTPTPTPTVTSTLPTSTPTPTATPAATLTPVPESTSSAALNGN